MCTKPTPAIVRDADRERPSQAALAALDRSIAEEQDFDAAPRRTLDRGEPAPARRPALLDGRKGAPSNAAQSDRAGCRR